MAIRIPLVQINGRLVELQVGDKISTEHIQPFEFIQETPATLWEIIHNMGKYPAISVTLFDGTEVFCDKKYSSPDEVILTFSKPVAGKAYLI